MSHPPLLLSPELWSHVFEYLSMSDKFNARACCKYFKRLVDHWSLWRDWTVVLTFPRSGPYNAEFWSTLRRRRVSSAVVKSSRTKDWKQLAQCLPTLSTLVVEHSCQSSLDCLKYFSYIKRLVIRHSNTSIVLDASTVKESQHLIHLNLCDVKLTKPTRHSFISAVSFFSNLTSLVCHHLGIFEHTSVMIHSVLSCLPKLEHLSLSVVHNLYSNIPGPDLYRSRGLANARTLFSLELIDCMDQSLSEDLMKLVPGLKSLSVSYKYTHQELMDRELSPLCHFKTWLSDLPHLTTLAIFKGPPVKQYVSSIPTTVTDLTLCVAGLSSQDLTATAAQLPDLLHLHINPWPSHSGAQTPGIPLLFPKLKCLKLPHEHIPESKFLALHRLCDLVYLEILDGSPYLSKLTEKLKALTDYKLQVITSPSQRNVLSCC